MKTSDFHYDLPPELIAQEPLRERTASRMMVIHRATGRWEHRHVTDLPDYLRAGDLLVVNNTRVIPARLFGRMTDTGGQVEVLLLEDLGQGNWEAMFKASRPARTGTTFRLGHDRVEARIAAVAAEGRVTLALTSAEPVARVMEEEGVPPLPPYIKREKERDPRTAEDRRRYQTVYARHAGAVAAPTAGLHFSESLLETLTGQGVRRAHVTLHVGPGTFKPVKVENVEDHAMEAERYEIDEAAASAIAEARQSGPRIVAVGSTSVRTLETVAKEQGSIVASHGRSSLFIYPPFEFQVVDAMLTNFHLPESTLIMMVSALAGRELVLRAYEEAVRQRYRFYSYGDCMLIV